MDSQQTIEQKPRYGFYYFPDSLHYTENDLHTWIPEFKALGASWLTLLAPADRAIPESFIRRVVEEGIQPLIHMPIPTNNSIHLDELNVLFNAYSHWGVKFIALFDRPNQLKNWSPSDWAKGNLVERFLDLFIPAAEQACQANLAPLFPPLEPGGDYWDTSFLFAALQAIQRRGRTELLNRMGLSAYAWSGNRSPNWGAGGPERWPATRPYLTPQNSEDHLGFRIFDWYLPIAEAATGESRPVFLLGAGSRLGDQLDPRSPAVDIHAHTFQNFTLAQLMTGRSKDYDPVPPEVMCCNFWLLSAAKDDDEAGNAWYRSDGTPLPIVSMIKEWISTGMADPVSSSKSYFSSSINFDRSRPISHYLLLPSADWGVSDWKLETFKPFIAKYQPTIGFSPIEASHAKKVTVIGGTSKIAESIIDGLLAAGCIVEQISGDGMNIAT